MVVMGGCWGLFRRWWFIGGVIGVVVVVLGCCVVRKGVESMEYRGPRLTPEQAKSEVYGVAREIIAAIHDVADIDKVGFDYESDNDDDVLPFRAIIGIPVTTHPRYAGEHLTDVYRDIVLALPGYSAKGNIRSHSPVVYKNDVCIYLPTHTSEAFEVNGPPYVYDDLHKLPKHWDWDTGAHGPLHIEDVTKDFIPPKKSGTPSTIARECPGLW